MMRDVLKGGEGKVGGGELHFDNVWLSRIKININPFVGMNRNTLAFVTAICKPLRRLKNVFRLIKRKKIANKLYP